MFSDESVHQAYYDKYLERYQMQALTIFLIIVC